MKPRGVGAPFHFEDLRPRDARRKDGRRRRDDQVGRRAQAVAPALHRTDEQGAVQPRLRGAGVVDDRRVHFEHGPRAEPPRVQDRFAAEVVVPLHHEIRAEAVGDPSHRRAARPAQLRRPERRRHRDPVHVVRGRRSGARRHQHVDLVAERGEPFRDRGDVDRSSLRARDDLVQRGVQDPHCLTSSAKNGPERIRPKSSRSSFMSAESARSAAYVGPRRAIRALADARGFADRGGIGVTGPGRRGTGPPRHRALGHAHQDVLDEPADQRRVVADASDAEPGLPRDRFEVRDVAQRVEVVRLAEPLLPQVDQVPAFELPRQPVDPLEAGGDRRVLADVRVDEQRAARLQHPRGLRQHAVERLGRQVLEHVERPGLVERRVGKRQRAQVAEHEVHLRARVLREERGDVDAHHGGAEVAVPDQRPPAPAAEVRDEFSGAGREKRAQHAVPDARPEQRRRDALVPRIGVKRLVEVFRLLGEHLGAAARPGSRAGCRTGARTGRRSARRRSARTPHAAADHGSRRSGRARRDGPRS